jgi:hypothetical protein
LCFTPSIVLPYSSVISQNYLSKSTLNYKVNENKLHFEAGWEFFLLTLYISKHKQHQSHEEKRHVTKVLLQAGRTLEQ